MSDKDEDWFASGKFVPRDSDEPVVGWVKMSAEVQRNYAAQVQRAVVISDKDRETLRKIRSAIEGAVFVYDDTTEQLALLDRLIGK